MVDIPVAGLVSVVAPEGPPVLRVDLIEVDVNEVSCIRILLCALLVYVDVFAPRRSAARSEIQR